MTKREITASDIIPEAQYGAQRKEWRQRMAVMKRRRRLAVGPDVTFYFENWHTMWHQVQEMLHIERGGADQLPDELAAYNPLVPQGRELCATFMIEITDAGRRKQVLGQLGGIEETAFLQMGDTLIKAVPEADQDRTSAEGKASSVQFVHFHFTDDQAERFREPGARVVLGLSHPRYSHMAVIPEEIRAELSGDFA